MSTYPGRTKGTRRVVLWHRGTRHERIVTGGKREAEEYEARWRLELEGADPVDPLRVPAFSDFCVSRYRPHAEKHLKASTWNDVRIYQVDTLCRHFGHLRLTEFTLAAVEKFKGDRGAEMVTWHGKTRPMRASSINNELRVFRTILNFAKDLGYPVPKLKWKRLPERGKGRAKAWSEDEVQALYAAAQAKYPELVPMFVFLMNTGCRKGEAIVAEWTWMDSSAGLVRIPSNEAWQPKNGLPREVPISDAVTAALGGKKAHPTYLFPNRNGSRYLRFPKDIFDRIRTAAKVTGGPHTFRHTYASHFLKAQPDLFLLGQVMGHSHQRVTELYSHMLPDHLARARNAVNVGPALKTVAGPVAEKTKKAKSSKK